ncbi:MAG: hypothetical protein UR93_C0010G0003 [Berkelbacteria bacterium GW2011_GWA2_35_9]|uniref:UPF0102 protein UR93_C0010G0003 n=1 Tax=Berkelbacteria bacterium GW2011_GWA2_35_9 TaxID=1618333 RepID=A0A0G0GAF9_9BACT|nr:MAG: hypothetical protein UR93_C0010G0003 [Berkelbacteria bacterium GW2011_GWA2_35_9]
MTMFRKKLGGQGEKHALGYLQKKGYQLITQNYYNYIGEIDLIMRDKKTIVFVEVKTKTELEFGNPLEMIDTRKQKKLLQCIKAYLHKNDLFEADVRIDAVSVVVDIWGNKLRIEHIENAVEDNN